MSVRIGARALLTATLDRGSFRSWDQPIAIPEHIDPEYASALERARESSGEDESVVTGQGTIEGIPVAVVVSEFGFLAGSVGVDCANRIEAAVRRATADRLPLLAAPASGGTRMQEGTIAFLQMVRITAALVDHKRAGLPYLVYLRHPTTGGVFASWGSLGHVTVGEPDALIGFLGPRVYEALTGTAFPEGVQRAENLAAHGVIDAVVPPEQLGALAARALRIILTPPSPVEPPVAPPVSSLSTWESIGRTRDPRRPGIRQLLHHATSDVLPLSGTAEGEQHDGVLSALARIGGVSCVLVGQDRLAQRRRGAIGPGALRQVRRSIRIAGELRLPLLTVIDTPGAALTVEAEEGGLGGEIARCLADLLELSSPIVSVILGEGAGGGALALLPADRIIAAENAWLAPLPPEGASAILHQGDTSFAPLLSFQQGVDARQLAQHGVIDELIAEPPDVAGFASLFAAAVGRHLVEAGSLPWSERAPLRSLRFARWSAPRPSA
ncbi:carboxyl transferase domain-containing protein [Leifsonia sp. NPDC058230]|uniref:carboxyl transferase domain-containing protein n=1 Tax=Leifsonia sp. NPDC058230 TaxID=3346391 RepID=UPI0036DBE0CB